MQKAHAYCEIGFTYNGASYYYGKNLFGDIVDIYNATGTKVAHYAYDAWGSHTVENLTTSAIGDLNPFRYRGYYYDDETKLYYLQTRYYDPNVGRFLSPDVLAYLGADGELRGYNLYTYCGNNPVMNVDPTGHFSIVVTILVATLFGAVLSSIGSVVHELSTYGLDLSKWNWELIGSKALLGAASGFAMGLGAAAAGMVLGSVALIGSMTTTQSVVTLLGIAAGVNFAAGIGAYAIETEEFNILYGIYKGVGQTARGVLDFFTAAMMVGAGWWPLRDLKLKETVGWAIKRGVAKYVGNFVLNNVIEELF